jgi:hypothetical protein
MMVAAVLLISILATALGQQRWYYTGKFKNNDVSDDRFDGVSFDAAALHDTSRHVLFYGGIISQAHATNTTAYDEIENIAKRDIFGMGNASSVRILQSVDYPLFIAKNYGLYSIDNATGNSTEVVGSLKLMGEVGLYDHQQRVFLEKYWRDIAVGEFKAVKFAVRHMGRPSTAAEGASTLELVDILATGEVVKSEPDPATPILEVKDSSSQPADTEESAALANNTTVSAEEGVHNVLYTTDLMGRHTVYSHTWTANEADAVEADAVSGAGPASTLNVRIMSYNLWHNNPPSWVYHNPR